MHWHSIRRSNDLCEDADSTASHKNAQFDGNDSINKGEVYLPNDSTPYPIGDDACDLKADLQLELEGNISTLAVLPGDVVSSSRATVWRRGSEMPQQATLDERIDPGGLHHSQASSAASRRSRLTEESVRSLNSSFSPPRPAHRSIANSNTTVADTNTNSTRTTFPFLQVSISTHATNNLAPFAYQRAMSNRILDIELGQGRKYDAKSYTPMFVHDCLMVPGSLANVGGKGSAENIVRRMTPALLPGFHAHVHAATHEPLILQSSEPGDYVHGMLVFGQSKQTRRNVHHHYRRFCKRIKVEVELDTVHPVPSHRQRCAEDRWELRRRSVWAHAWIWKNAQSTDARFRSQWVDDGWRFDDYLAGKHESAQSMRIEPAGWIEDDRESTATDDMSKESGIRENLLEDWNRAAGEPEGQWEEGSGGGAAVEWDESALTDYNEVEGDDEDSTCVARGTFDRDYDRSGSAGCW